MPKATARTDSSAGPTFVVTHTWPEIRNAEYEVLQRLAVAANNIGATMIAVDNDGRPLWSNPRRTLDMSKPIDPSEIDFMISLHFESPRLIDVYSYYALWQPLDFYFQFGYEQSLQKMLTHNDCLSCLSDFADAHAHTTFGARGPLNPEPFPALFHNVPQPYLEPRIDGGSRLFYIGINWERAGQSKGGRHSKVFELLDGDEVLDIYGPRKLLNFSPWEGFKSYRGELPFDGLSTVTAINSAGICLALSSEAHKRAGLMSNRLFEGLAAGAAVVVDSNRFALKHFSDVAYFIDDRGSAEDVAFQIKTIVEQIRRDPEEAIARVRRGQARLAETFSLEGSLRRLIEDHPKRVEYYRGATLSAGSVSVLMVHQDGSLDDLLGMIANAAAQTMVDVDVVLIGDTAFLERHREAILAARKGAVRAIKLLPLDLARVERVAGQPPVQVCQTGPKVAEAFDDLNTDYFCFLRSDEAWFHDHLAGLVAALKRQSGAVMAVSGAIEQATESSKTTRTVAELRFTGEGKGLVQGQYGGEPGRFLFARSLADRVPRACLTILDGQEPNLVRVTAALEGDPAQTGYATYVRDTAKTQALPEPIIPERQQQQYIRDTVAFDHRWLAMQAREPGDARPGQAPVPPDPSQRSPGVTRHLALDRLVELSTGAEGLKYLERGFSPPEHEGSWIDGKVGTIEFYSTEQAWAPDQDRDLVIYMRGRSAHDTGRPQHCTVVLNGVTVAYVEAPERNSHFAIRIPRNAFAADGRMRVELIADHAEPVCNDEGQILDPRRLSLHIQRFGLVSRIIQPRPELAAETVHLFTAGSPALSSLRDGFLHSDGPDLVLLGKGAHLVFETPGFADPMRLTLWMSDRSTGRGSGVEHVLVAVNDVPHGVFAITAAETEVSLMLQPEVVGEDGVCAVTLEFGSRKAQPGDIVAVQLHKLQIVDARPPEPPPPPGLILRIKIRLKRILGAVLGRP